MDTISIIMLSTWIAVFVVALLAEIFTEALVSIWFCVGSLITIGLSFIPNMPFWGEIIIFVSTSLLSFFILKPIFAKFLNRNKSSTNIDAIIGKKGVMTKTISFFDYGEVKVNGVLWTAAKRDNGEIINEGDGVEVVGVDGNKLIVKKIVEEEN